MKSIKKIFFISKKSSAFSLMEVLIAMSILTLIIGGITLFSVRTIQAHSRSQAMQNALENARFAIESINKMARTSKLDVVNATTLSFISNEESAGYVTYAFIGERMNFTSASVATAALVGGAAGNSITVSGRFTGNPSSDTQRGFVVTEITVTYNSPGSPSEKDSVTIRSGVSTRY